MTDQSAASAPDASTEQRVATLAGLPADVASTSARGVTSLFPPRERYLQVLSTLQANGFDMCRDLCGVDYLTHMDRPLPASVKAERFEVVANLLSIEDRQQVRVRVQIPADDPTCPTLFFLYPGTENMERETYDMFGITFTDHPDPTRILMPQDWEGHPLRKDYGVGRVPVQFKNAPGPR